MHIWMAAWWRIKSRRNVGMISGIGVSIGEISEDHLTHKVERVLGCKQTSNERRNESAANSSRIH